MKDQTPISIVVVSDNHFMIMLAALIKSIECNHLSGEPLHFYIVEDNVTGLNKEKLHKSFNNKAILFTWININDAIPKGVKLPLDKSSFPLNIYLRLFMPYFLPSDAEKAIYLDADMIVMDDISNLWKIELEDNLCAAVQDKYVSTVSNSWGGIKNYKELGLDPGTMYLNSGMMIFNLSLWRQQNIADKILKCIEENKHLTNFPDQYGLNVVLANRWKSLDERWNYFASGDLLYPSIIHFARIKPFYKNYDGNPVYRERFYEFVNATKWKGTKPLTSYSRYAKKMLNVLRKFQKKMVAK